MIQIVGRFCIDNRNSSNVRAEAGEFDDYSDVHMQAIDPRSSIPEPLVAIFVLGILVNRDGVRFVDEAPGAIDVHGENIVRAINRQPGGIVEEVAANVRREAEADPTDRHR